MNRNRSELFENRKADIQSRAREQNALASSMVRPSNREKPPTNNQQTSAGGGRPADVVVMATNALEVGVAGGGPAPPTSKDPYNVQHKSGVTHGGKLTLDPSMLTTENEAAVAKVTTINPTSSLCNPTILILSYKYLFLVWLLQPNITLILTVLYPTLMLLDTSNGARQINPCQTVFAR